MENFETIDYPLYDCKYFIGTQLEFFDCCNFSRHTNMEIANSFPNGKTFLLEAITASMLPATSDNYSVLASAELDFDICSKLYLRVNLSSFMVLSLVRKDDVAWRHAVECLPYTDNLPVKAEIPLHCPLYIDKGYFFRCSLRWDIMPVPKSGALVIVCLHGKMRRPVC